MNWTTIDGLQEIKELCIDLRRWYRGEETELDWSYCCWLCDNSHMGSCEDCPWVVFTGKDCMAFAVKAEFEKAKDFIIGLRSTKTDIHWNFLRENMLTNWIKKINRKIYYLKTGG